jgi:hypothetical protein
MLETLTDDSLGSFVRHAIVDLLTFFPGNLKEEVYDGTSDTLLRKVLCCF